MCGRVCRGKGAVLCCPRPVFKLRTLYRQTDTAVTLCSLCLHSHSLLNSHTLLLSISLSLNDFNCKSFKCFQFAFNFNWLICALTELCLQSAAQLLRVRSTSWFAVRILRRVVACRFFAAFVFVLLHSCVRVSFSLSHTLTLCSRSVAVCYSDV